MTERRPLVEGLKTTAAADPSREKAFVYGEKAAEIESSISAPSAKPTPIAASAAVGRVPISTRMRSDFAAALKKASLERQLNGVEPNTLQDILEEAVAPWLKANGYLT